MFWAFPTQAYSELISFLRKSLNYIMAEASRSGYPLGNFSGDLALCKAIIYLAQALNYNGQMEWY